MLCCPCRNIVLNYGTESLYKHSTYACCKNVIIDFLIKILNAMAASWYGGFNDYVFSSNKPLPLFINSACRFSFAEVGAGLKLDFIARCREIDKNTEQPNKFIWRDRCNFSSISSGFTEKIVNTLTALEYFSLADPPWECCINSCHYVEWTGPQCWPTL